MQNNDNEDIKVIKYESKNDKEEQKNETERETKTDSKKNENKKKLKAQRTKAPKVYLQNLKNEKKSGFSLFCSCLGSNKDDDDDD